ncbi:radical SAM protein [Candidatus Kuenenia sp.]|uniref:radical SAM protein n=1 Tax=Candidatus Kuenenia sp. TaxID=2499824 RepID=UPI0032204BDD
MSLSSDISSNKYILRIFRKAFLPWVFTSPRYLGVLWNFYKKIKKRYKLKDNNGNPIPHTIFISLLSDCNLACDHCYARVYKEKKILPGEMLENILLQAESLGSFIFMLTGGEPMLYPNLMEILGGHKNSFFILITNGTMISETVAKKLSGLPHIIPVISLEGDLRETDKRRGAGVYHNVMNAFANLKNNKIFYGFSITVTAENVELIQVEESFLEKYPFGARLGLFIEYMPTGRSHDYGLSLSTQQRTLFRQWFLNLKERTNTYLLHLPNDGRLLDCSRKAGSEFIHINPEGYTASCILLPSDKYNVSELPLEVCIQRLHKDNEEGKHLCETSENHPCMNYRKRLKMQYKT